MFSPLTDWLYDYAMDKRLDGRFTDGEEEYVSSLFSAESSLGRLTEILDKPARDELDRYVQARDRVEYYHRKALFSSGLSIGQKLSRL